MVSVIFSVLGVVFAFTGLGVFLLALIALLPVNIYNAIVSSIKLHQAIALSDTSVIPVLFFSGNILLALISLGLFYKITRIEDKTELSSATKIKTPVSGNQTSNHHAFSHHKHSLMNWFTYSYITIDVVWALVGALLVYSLMSGHNSEKMVVVMGAIKTQVYTLWINLFVLTGAACAMGLASLLFMLGKKKKSSHDETRPLLSVV